MKGLVIAGPTGVGKTDLSLKLAKVLNAVIISSDSAQIYKGMDIGTAKIREEEMQGIKHYMIDILEPTRKYSVGEYQKNVDDILKTLEKEDKFVILTGGTGLYINAITNGLSDLPKGDEKIRERYRKLSKEELFEKLKEVDPEAAIEIHMNNRKRVERALEVFELTHEKFSIISKKNIKKNNYDFVKIALERDREVLYDRINRRVDIMIEQGLEKEVKNLYEKYGDILRKINIIGYSEFIDYFKGKISYEETISIIKKNSRRYAKRQFTWFKNDKSYIWFNLDNLNEDKIVQRVLKIAKQD